MGNDELMQTNTQTNSEPELGSIVQPSTSKNADQNMRLSSEPRTNGKTLDLNDLRDYDFDDDYNNARLANIKEKESRSKMGKKRRKKKQNTGQKSSQKRKRTSAYSSGFLMGTSSESDDSSFVENDEYGRSCEDDFTLNKVLRIKNKPLTAVIKKVDKNWEQLKSPGTVDLYDPETFDEQFWLKKYNIKKCQIKLKKLEINPNYSGTIRIIKKNKKEKNENSKNSKIAPSNINKTDIPKPNDSILNNKPILAHDSILSNKPILAQKVTTIKHEPKLIPKTPEKTPLKDEIKRKLLAEDDDLPDLDFIVKRPLNINMSMNSGENSTKSLETNQKPRILKTNT